MKVKIVIKNSFYGTLAKLIVVAIVLTTILCGSASAQTATETLDAVRIVRAVETQYQGSSSHGRMQMTIKTSNWHRTLEMESWSEGRDKLLTRITSPARERGTCTLKVDNDIWNYIARIDRLIKIPSSLMGDSWMGSHLTNDDLVKENKIDLLYDLEITHNTPEKIIIVGIPRPDAAVVWGRIEYTIDAARLVPEKIEYFDESRALVRTLSFSDVQRKGDRWLPMTITIQPVEKPEEYTQMRHLSIDFDLELPRNLFSIKSLRNR